MLGITNIIVNPLFFKKNYTKYLIYLVKLTYLRLFKYTWQTAENTRKYLNKNRFRLRFLKNKSLVKV